jgi:hypothetical protein
MYLQEDADLATVVTTTAKAMLEATRHFSRSDGSLTPEQIGQLEIAIRELQRVLVVHRNTNRFS